MVRKAFKVAQTERPGSCYLGVPQDLEEMSVSPSVRPLLRFGRCMIVLPLHRRSLGRRMCWRRAKSPIVLAGHGAARENAQDALIRFSEQLHIPVATTFMGKGVFPDMHPNALGTVGFMHHDYVNFGFDLADVLVCVGYDLQEFDPVRINPNADKKSYIFLAMLPRLMRIILLQLASRATCRWHLMQLAKGVRSKEEVKAENRKIVDLLRAELEEGARDDSFPVKPQRIVSDTRLALGDSDIVLVETGALKMWMARLYPTFKPNTCLISNGLSTMAFALPGAIAVKLAYPERKVLARLEMEGS